MSVKPEDLDFVVMSHLDCDPVGGLRELAVTKHIMTCEDEIASASSYWSRTRATHLRFGKIPASRRPK